MEAWTGGPVALGVPERLAGKFPWAAKEVRLARMDWLDWDRMPSSARLAALTRPSPRILRPRKGERGEV